jgi:hypothetical protein
MEKIIKKQLLLLQEELNDWKGSFEAYDYGYEDEFEDRDYSRDDPLTLSVAIGVGKFIKKGALLTQNYELIGLSEAIIQKAQKLEKQERKKWDEYNDSREEEYWEDKTYYNATELGTRLNISASGTKTNKILEGLGYQIRQNNGWVATEKAANLCKQENIKEGKKPYIRWKKEFIDHLSQKLETYGDLQN